MAKSRRKSFEVPVLTPASDKPGHAELRPVKVDKVGASRAGTYWSAGYGRFLATGDVSVLEPFEGETLGGLPLLTDPDLIEDFYFEHGHIDFQEYYNP
jgi:hypothetical protein